MSGNAHSVINELNSVIGGFTSHVDKRIYAIDEQTQHARSAAETALARIQQFKKDMIADEQMQSAHENILRLDQIIREKFESNIKVRRTVMGVVKDFDINLCRNSTIEELSEELWITSSRYWLSFALISLSAWVNDSKVLADNAVSEAVRTNAIKSNLFFCLVNLRFGRLDAAKKWLTQYFRSVVPTAIQNETAVLLQAYINGVFGVDKSLEYEIQRVVDSWVKDINMDANLTAELVADFEGYISKINPEATFSFPNLSRYCSVASQMQMPYLESFKYAKMIALVKSLDVERIMQNASNYKQRIDAIMTDLITNYDDEELAIKEQKEYYQLIMDNKGNIEAAEAQFKERQRVRGQTQNIGRKLIEWALYKTSGDINIHVRKFAFQNAKGWFLTALENWSARVEAAFPTSYPITIDDWSCVSTGDDQLEQENAFREHLEKNKLRTMYFNNPNILMMIGFLVGLIGGLCTVFNESSRIIGFILLAVALVCGVIVGIRCATAGSKFKKMVAEKLGILSACMAELTKVRNTYYANIQNKNKLFNMTEHL